MKKIAMILAIAVAGLLAGCVVVPAGSRPVPVVGQTAIVIDDSGAPPAEFVVEGQPVYYTIEPGVAFYPVFLGFPGSCFCIMPVRFVAGVWYAPGGVVVHRGHFPFYHPGHAHLNVWRGNHRAFRGHAAEHGRLEHGPAGKRRPVPPAGHARPRGPVPHVAPPQRPAQPHVQPRTEQRQSAPRAAPPQPQARPQPQQQQRVPAKKAPPKQCPADKKC